MTLLTASTVLLAAVLCSLMVRTLNPDPDWRTMPHWVPLAMVAVPLALICGFAYWGFSPIVEQRRRVEAVLEKALGMRTWALETAADSAARKQTRDAVSSRFRVKVMATVALVVVSLSLHYVVPHLAIWIPPAVFYGGMIVWELAFSSKAKRECFAHASFWALLFLTSFGAELIPSESVWKAITPLVGLAALTFVVWRHAEGIPAQTLDSVMEAYHCGDYKTALERAEQMDPTYSDRHTRHRLRAMIHYRRREFDQAEIHIRKGLLEQWDCRKASRLLSMLASVLIEKMQYEEATKVLDGAAELDRLNGSVDRYRALVFLRQGISTEKALQFSQQALVSSEDEKAQALAVRAWALAENGRQTEARTVIDHALGLPSARSKPDAAEVCYYAGRATFNNRTSIIAERYFLGAIDAEPDGLFGALARTGLRKCQPMGQPESSGQAWLRRRRIDDRVADAQGPVKMPPPDASQPLKANELGALHAAVRTANPAPREGAEVIH